MPALRKIQPGLMSLKDWLTVVGTTALKRLLPLDRSVVYLATHLENTQDY
jgi:hypothetical protein